MSTLTVKVCEECGAQSATGEGWLVIADIDIRWARTNQPVIHSEGVIDLCSPGCVLRYLSRSLEPAMNGHAAAHKHAEIEGTKPPIRMFI
jgi:hypothetical protein